MKYKHIDAMLHNFGHSFVSLMNYVDDQHLIDVLNNLVRQTHSCELDIDFTNGRISLEGSYPEVLFKSISYWKNWLPKDIANHRIEAERLSDIHLCYAL